MYTVTCEKLIPEEFFLDFPALAETYCLYQEMIKYEEAYYQGELVCEFVVCKKHAKIISIMPMTISRSFKMSFFNKALAVYWKENLHADDYFESSEKILQYLEQKIKTKEVSEIIISADSYLVHAFLNEGANLKYNMEGVVDLRLSENLIKRSFRKSYRSLINWGQREMQFVSISKDNPIQKHFEEFRNFHIKTAGRETRDQKTWEHQWNFIKSGNAFLELGFLNGEMVSGALVLCGKKEAYYAVAVNNRTLMAEKKAIGHATICNSILKAKSLGCEIFNLGHLGPSFSNEKELEIGKFKKGFTSQARLKHYLEIKI